MRSPKTVIERGQALLGEVFRAMCREPGELRVQFHDDGTTIRVQLTAHPSDARILVGTNGAHIKQLASLAKSLFWGSHRVVQILEVESHDEPQLPSYYFRPAKEWNDRRMRSLLTRLAEAAFPDATCEIESAPHSTWSQNMALTLTPEPSNRQAVHCFAAALSVLFIPIGKRDGRIVYVTVRSKNQVADKATA